MSKSGNYEVTIYQNKMVSKIGWFWKVKFPEDEYFSYSGVAFTYRGAVREVKRYIKSHKAGNKTFYYEVEA